MAQIYELFDGSGPGVYWFYSTSLHKWIVADMDTGKAYHVDGFCRMDFPDNRSDGRDRVDRMRTGVLGCVGDRVVMERETAIVFLRDHAADVSPDTFVVHESDGSVSVGAAAYKVLAAVGAAVGRIREKRKGKELD